MAGFEPRPPRVPGEANGREGLIPRYDVSGVGREAGWAMGESARELVNRHHAIVVDRLASRGMSLDEARAATHPFRDVTSTVAPDLAAEVDGVGEGAGLETEDAWILQLRTELLILSEPAEVECSSLAVTEGTETGGVLAGQNVDLPPEYADLFVLLRRDQPGRPTLATVTPAGQLAHHGINEAGVAVFANYLHGDRAHRGVPRYLLTRVALACVDRHRAVDAISGMPRSKPRNILIADDAGAVNAETTPQGVRLLEPHNGVVFHTNHYVAEGSTAQESPDPQFRRNSRTRLARMRDLLYDAEFERSIPGIIDVLADRVDAPDAICHRADDIPGLHVATVMMTVADIGARELWVRPGGPEGGPMQRFSFAAGLHPASTPEARADWNSPASVGNR